MLNRMEAGLKKQYMPAMKTGFDLADRVDFPHHDQLVPAAVKLFE
jgi:hypothetical protein